MAGIAVTPVPYLKHRREFDMRTVTATEAKIIYEILLTHEAQTLSLSCVDSDKLNLMLDHLRGMLLDIGDGELQAHTDVVKAIEKLIKDEGKLMDEIKKTDPQNAMEKLCYILGLSKALSIIQGK